MGTSQHRPLSSAGWPVELQNELSRLQAQLAEAAAHEAVAVREDKMWPAAVREAKTRARDREEAAGGGRARLQQATDGGS